MLRLASRLSGSIDPVVAVHDSAEQAKAAVELLGRAGYPSRMLGVVDGRSPPACTTGPDSLRPARWRTSGTLWGLAWAACAVVGAAIIARQALPAGLILMVGALLLVIQTAIVRASLAPESSTQAAWRGARPSERGYASELAANKTLLVVSGSRSDIALARSLLSPSTGAD